MDLDWIGLDLDIYGDRDVSWEIVIGVEVLYLFSGREGGRGKGERGRGCVFVCEGDCGLMDDG